MKLSDKIVALRKASSMSQEELAEKLNLSRQAVSRWEMGTAMPDALNILQLSKLFGVTTDYLLNDDFESDNDLPKIKEIKSSNLKQLFIWLVTLEVMVLLLQFMTTFLLQNAFFACLSFVPFVGLIGGFEYAYHTQPGPATETVVRFRKHFYKVSAWLGLYFPARFIATMAATLYPRPYSSLAFECVVLILYIGAATLVSLSIEKNALKKENKAA